MLRSSSRAGGASDRWLLLAVRGCAAVAGLIVVLIIVFLVIESIPALRHVGLRRFFTDASWHPAASADDGTFNLLPMVIGTLAAMSGAVLLATPIGIASAMFCQYYAPRKLAQIYRRLVELLAGIPSVVYGFWGLVVLVPIIRTWAPPGPSLLAGVLILTVMVLPTIALLADAALANVPRDELRAAAAVGLGRWGTLRGVVLPHARPGLMTGVILETGRAIGETMAILMVCGNIVQIPSRVFDPIRTLTSNIALELGYALGDHRSALFVSGLLLIAMIIALVAFAELITKGRLHA